MRIHELARSAGFEVVQGEATDGEIAAGYASDLLSDVMAHAPADSVLVTIQAHKNTIAVATLAGIRAIVVCNGRAVPDDMFAAAREQRVAIWRSAENQFTVSHRLFSLLHPA